MGRDPRLSIIGVEIILCLIMADIPQGSCSITSRILQLDFTGKMTNRQLGHNGYHLFSDHISNLPFTCVLRGITHCLVSLFGNYMFLVTVSFIN